MFNDFKTTILEGLKALGYYAKIEVIAKLQEGSSEKLIVSRAYGDNVRLCFDIGEMYEDGMDCSSALDIITDAIRRPVPFSSGSLDSLGLTYESVKERLFIQVVGRDRNEAFLNEIPHTVMGDLAVVYRVMVEASDGISSFLITNRMVNEYGVSVEQLHADALVSTQNVLPAEEPMNLSDFLGPLFDLHVDETHGGFDLYVCSNKTRMNGASVIFYPGYLEKAAEKLGGSFYILPSSIHEVLLLNDISRPAKDCQQIVQDINRSVVDPKDVLSDSIYFYDAERKTVCTIE